MVRKTAYINTKDGTKSSERKWKMVSHTENGRPGRMMELFPQKSFTNEERGFKIVFSRFIFIRLL